MATYYRIAQPLTGNPAADLTNQIDFKDMTPAQLAVIINNTEVKVIGMTRNLVIASKARKNAKEEWRRRHGKTERFAAAWATKAHKKAYPS